MLYKQSNLLIFAVLVAVLCACSKTDDAKSLQNGDLAFVTSGTSQMSQAIAEATKADAVDYDHVGIVRIDSEGQAWVIDASPKHGVAMRRWNEFVDEATYNQDSICIVIMRAKVSFDTVRTINNALSRLGQPYDWAFAPNNNASYCSELVEECYVNTLGQRIFDKEPMNFYDSEGHLPDFWRKNFDSLGIDVPQGALGTNPNQIAKQCIIISQIENK